MNVKKAMDLLLSKVAEGQREAFIADLREAGTKKERAEVFAKYGVSVSDEEREAIRNSRGSEVSDEALDQANGGCSPSCAYVHCECTGCV